MQSARSTSQTSNSNREECGFYQGRSHKRMHATYAYACVHSHSGYFALQKSDSNICNSSHLMCTSSAHISEHDKNDTQRRSCKSAFKRDIFCPLCKPTQFEVIVKCLSHALVIITQSDSTAAPFSSINLHLYTRG